MQNGFLFLITKFSVYITMMTDDYYTYELQKVCYDIQTHNVQMCRYSYNIVVLCALISWTW